MKLYSMIVNKKKFFLLIQKIKFKCFYCFKHGVTNVTVRATDINFFTMVENMAN